MAKKKYSMEKCSIIVGKYLISGIDFPIPHL